MANLTAKASALQAYKPMFSARAVVQDHHIEHLGDVFYWTWWLDAHRGIKEIAITECNARDRLKPHLPKSTT